MDSAVGGDERVLGRVLSALGRREHTEAEVMEGSLVLFDEAVEGVEVALRAAIDEVLFVEVCDQR